MTNPLHTMPVGEFCVKAVEQLPKKKHDGLTVQDMVRAVCIRYECSEADAKKHIEEVLRQRTALLLLVIRNDGERKKNVREVTDLFTIPEEVEENDIVRTRFYTKELLPERTREVFIEQVEFTRKVLAIS